MKWQRVRLSDDANKMILTPVARNLPGAESLGFHRADFGSFSDLMEFSPT
jgi:hypothetical protein